MIVSALASCDKKFDFPGVKMWNVLLFAELYCDLWTREGKEEWDQLIALFSAPLAHGKKRREIRKRRTGNETRNEGTMVQEQKNWKPKMYSKNVGNSFFLSCFFFRYVTGIVATSSVEFSFQVKIIYLKKRMWLFYLVFPFAYVSAHFSWKRSLMTCFGGRRCTSLNANPSLLFYDHKTPAPSSSYLRRQTRGSWKTLSSHIAGTKVW